MGQFYLELRGKKTVQWEQEIKYFSVQLKRAEKLKNRGFIQVFDFTVMPDINGTITKSTGCAAYMKNIQEQEVKKVVFIKHIFTNILFIQPSC